MHFETARAIIVSSPDVFLLYQEVLLTPFRGPLSCNCDESTHPSLECVHYTLQPKWCKFLLVGAASDTRKYKIVPPDSKQI